MKIAIISTSALPAPPIGYGGLEWIAYHSALELYKMGNEVYLLTTNESTALGVQETLNEKGEKTGSISVVACGPTSWNYNGERDMFLNYHTWLEQNFSTNGVIIDHTWWGYPYYSLSGGEITLTPDQSVKIEAHPGMKIMHVIHGVTGWRNQTNGAYVPPPGVTYPRILGVSKEHAQYLTNCFKIPVRHVYNGVKIPDNVGFSNMGPTSTLREEGLDSTPPFLLSLNRISKEKGIHNSIDVCLATSTPLKVVGDDVHVSDQNYVFEIMERCSKSGGLIEYVGNVTNDQKWDYIRRCRGLITCPDLENYKESFYMAAVEGWSQGKPILALPNCGLADIVVDGVNGFQCKTVEDMKEILVKGKETFIQQVADPNLYTKGTVRLEDINPDIIKQEALKYTTEAMALAYLDLCRGVENNDPSYRW